MRTQLIGLLFLGLTGLIQAQTNIETNVETKSVHMKDVVISSNSKYMNKVYDDNSSGVVKNLQQIVAGFDLKSNEAYSEEHDNYSVHFKTPTTTSITATFDRDGTILSSNEKYNDILLPLSVRQALVKDYPGWRLHSNSYRVTYDHRNGIKKGYKLQVRKDDNKKNLKINIEGNMAIVSVDYD